MAMRRKFSSAHKELDSALRYLERLDDQNQQRAAPRIGRPATDMLSRSQLYSLNESAFFAAFRALENFVEECFILYTMGKRNIGNSTAKTYILSRDYERNRRIIKSGNHYLDWNTPERVIERAELFLKEGEPVKRIFQSNADVLRRMKRIRNHIAHNSDESNSDFRKVVRHELGALPVRFPSAGEFLDMRTPRLAQSSFLRHYISEIGRIAFQLSH